MFLNECVGCNVWNRLVEGVIKCGESSKEDVARVFVKSEGWLWWVAEERQKYHVLKCTL